LIQLGRLLRDLPHRHRLTNVFNITGQITDVVALLEGDPGIPRR
jgi:hypothetical protein